MRLRTIITNRLTEMLQLQAFDKVRSPHPANKKTGEESDSERIGAATKALNDAMMPIGAKMYQQAAEESKTDESTDKKSDKDEPVEGEVVDEDKK